MAHITLISPFEDIAALGNRHVGAYARRFGHTVRYLYIPWDEREDKAPLPYAPTITSFFKPETLDTLVEACKGSDVVGVSVMTNYLSQATQATHAVHENLGVPVVWGGIHPTVAGEECCRLGADWAVEGEGEETLVDIVDAVLGKGDRFAIKNTTVIKDGEVIKHPTRALEQNLDAFPAPDYDLADDWALLPDHRLVPMDVDLFREYLRKGVLTQIRGKISYQTMTSRGCPHNCSFCCNNALRRIYENERYVRMRSVPHVIAELQTIKERYPFIAGLGFSDDSFFSRRDDDFDLLCKELKSQIDLPFNCLVTPSTTTEFKIQCAIEGGCDYIQMGIQSASKRMKRIFLRYHGNDRTLETIKMLSKYAHRMHPPVYDFIINNPLDELEDSMATLEFLQEMPYPYRLQLFSLVPFPGTELRRLFEEKGLLQGEPENGYQVEYNYRQISYINVLFALYRRNVSKKVMAVLTKPFFINLFQNDFLSRVGTRIFRAYKALKAFAKPARKEELTVGEIA